MDELGRNTIHKLGKRVREAYGDGTGHVEEADLKLLQDYRLSYRDDIAAVFKILYEVSKKNDKHCIVTYRLKRINSIIEKLKRFPTAALENFVDIAGCRCITEDERSVYKIVKKIKHDPRLKVGLIKDYIQTPQPEGYRSVHLYVSLADSTKKLVEIQVRTRKQHDWATLVEISDVIVKGARLKEYGQPADLLEFHRILSVPEEELTDTLRNFYFDILNKYDYINLMHEVFLQNISLRYQWINTFSSGTKDFYLIESGAKKQTKIESYQTFHDAENAYFERFRQNPNANLILTQIPNVTFEQLSTAYSNYVLSTHNFTNDCINRCMKEIKNALWDRDLDRFETTLDTYLNAVAHQMIRMNQEIYTLNHSDKLQQNPKQREWVKDLERQMAQLMSRRDKLRSLYKETKLYEEGWLTRIRFEIISRKLANKYDDLVKASVKRR